jgi:hypothetical protein
VGIRAGGLVDTLDQRIHVGLAGLVRRPYLDPSQLAHHA